MERYLYGLLMFGTGILMALQPPVNAALGRRTNPLTAASINFAVGTIVLVAVALVLGQLALSGARGAPWWQFAGGLLGALFVFGSIVLLPKLGATGLIVALVGGQLAGSVLIDRFGVAGVPVVGLTPVRIAGIALLLAGGALVLKR